MDETMILPIPHELLHKHQSLHKTTSKYEWGFQLIKRSLPLLSRLRCSRKTFHL